MTPAVLLAFYMIRHLLAMQNTMLSQNGDLHFIKSLLFSAQNMNNRCVKKVDNPPTLYTIFMLLVQTTGTL